MKITNQSQTESYEVFHNSDRSYEQYVTYCICYLFNAYISQPALNTVLFDPVDFCRNFKGIQPAQSVFNNFTIFDFLLFSLIYYNFNTYQIKL